MDAILKAYLYIFNKISNFFKINHRRQEGITNISNRFQPEFD
jgi:hypothetical protein